VLADAFYHYPVMRYVLAVGSDDYTNRLHKLVHLFVMARVLRAEPMFGILDGSELCAAATMSYPGGNETPVAFNQLRAETWDQLGGEARARYDRCVAAWQPMSISVPHLHLNMIGVRQTYQGNGLARRLLDHVHGLSQASPVSTGVSLTTERLENLALYRYFGYELVGHAQVAPELESWGMFRPDHAMSPTERSPR
jgi:GNAT superfamily N-acetyltransferase